MKKNVNVYRATCVIIILLVMTVLTIVNAEADFDINYAKSNYNLESETGMLDNGEKWTALFGDSFELNHKYEVTSDKSIFASDILVYEYIL